MKYEKVIIIDDLDFVKANFEKISRIIREEGASLLPLSDIAFLFLKEKGIDALDLHKFEYRGIYEDVYPAALKWGSSWYRPRGKDYSEVHSYSLGSTIEWYMIYFFSHLLRRYLLLKEVIRSTAPGEVVLLAAQHVDLLSMPMKLRNINIDALPDIIRRLVSQLSPSTRVRVIKLPYSVKAQKRKFNFIRPFFYYLNLILSNSVLRVYQAACKGKVKIVFYEGFRHFYSIMASERLKDFKVIHLQKTIGPSLSAKFYAKGVKIDILYRKKIIAGRQGALLNLEALKADLSGFFTYKGEDVLAAVLPRIEFLFRDFLPRFVYPDLNGAVNYIRKARPNCLVVENDATYTEKMLVMVAKKLGINSVVVQNGATCIGDTLKVKGVPIHDFNTLLADRLFVFGQLNKDWCCGMGIDSSRIMITGAARFDNYYKARERTGRIVGAEGGRTVLILLNDTTDQDVIVSEEDFTSHMFYRHIKEYIQLARKNQHINFIVRPHHDMRLWNHIFSAELKNTPNLTITREHSLEESFGKSEVVIGYYSTALIEALIFGKVVISLDTGEYANILPLWDYGLSRRVSSFEELAAALDSLLHDVPERRRILENVNKNLYLLNYNNDGLASGRVAEELRKIAVRN